MTSATASVESIIEPRTDSSASRLWGGTRSGRSLLASSATRTIRSGPLSRERHRRARSGAREGYNSVENQSGSSPTFFPCHFGLYLHRLLWKTLWTIVNRGSDKKSGPPGGGPDERQFSAQPFSG